jgi:hypothetical protein
MLISKKLICVSLSAITHRSIVSIISAIDINIPNKTNGYPIEILGLVYNIKKSITIAMPNIKYSAVNE